MDKTELTLKEGQTYQLVAFVEPDDATNPVILWESLDEETATVDNTGYVTAISEGETIVKANTCDGSDLEATCVIIVKPDWSVGIDEVDLENVVINVSGNHVIIQGLTEGTDVRLYSLDGALIYQKISHDNEVKIEVSKNSIHILSINGRPLKLIVR